jgi:hypothetical protein
MGALIGEIKARGVSTFFWKFKGKVGQREFCMWVCDPGVAGHPSHSDTLLLSQFPLPISILIPPTRLVYFPA